MKLAAACAVLVGACLAAPGAPEAGRGALACIAPTKVADSAKPITAVPSLEFYVDEGDPLRSYGNEFVLVRSATDNDGRIRNDYRVGPPEEVRGTILFAGETPVSFAVGPLKKTYVSLQKNDDETAFMADAVPGIVCYSVTIETNTF